MAWRRPWIKLWTELLDDPKYLDLGPAQQAVWVNLLLATTRSPEPGKMLRPNGSPMGLEHIRAAVRAYAMTPEEFAATVEQMESMEMVHWAGQTLVITHWHERQDPESTAQRMRRYRERQRTSNGRPEDETLAVTQRHAEGNAPAPSSAPDVTQGVTQRHAEGNAPGAPAPTEVTPSVTERHAQGPSEVTERNEPEPGSPDVTPCNADAQEAVTATVMQRHPRGTEGKRGVGQSPTPEEQRERRNPSGAIAPEGPAQAPTSTHSSPDVPGDFGDVPEEAGDGDLTPNSPQHAGGGGTAPRPEINGEDSRPESAGGERAAPRAMSGRRKTGGNPQVDGVLEAIQELWGQPVVHWAKEAREVKAALARGYQPEQVLECWKAAQESPRWKGRWMPLAYLVEDLGEFVKNGGRPLRKWGAPPGKEDARAESRPPLPTAEEWRSRRGRW